MFITLQEDNFENGTDFKINIFAWNLRIMLDLNKLEIYGNHAYDVYVSLTFSNNCITVQMIHTFCVNYYIKKSPRYLFR